MSAEDLFSRRQMVAMGAGAAGYAMSSISTSAQTAMGGHGSGSDARPTSAPFEDPKTKYPKPPYPSQEQPWPGLASKMHPRPDHGAVTRMIPSCRAQCTSMGISRSISSTILV
jgi:hypothetical protein